MSDSERSQGQRHSASGPLATVPRIESDEALAARAKTDPQATEELFRRYVHRIRAYCARRLADEETARDAEGVILLKAFESLNKSPIEKFDSWIFSIAHNVVCNIHRDRRFTTELDLLGDLVSDSALLEDAVVSNLDFQELRNLVSGLSSGQRDVVELRLAGLNGREIGESLGKSRTWVDTTQYRAVQKLRGLLRGHSELEAKS